MGKKMGLLLKNTKNSFRTADIVFFDFWVLLINSFCDQVNIVTTNNIITEKFQNE